MYETATKNPAVDSLVKFGEIYSKRESNIRDGFIFDFGHSNWNNCLKNLRVLDNDVIEDDECDWNFIEFSLEHVIFLACQKLDPQTVCQNSKLLLTLSLLARHGGYTPLCHLVTVNMDRRNISRYFRNIDNRIKPAISIHKKLLRVLAIKGLKETFGGWRPHNKTDKFSNYRKKDILKYMVENLVYLIHNYHNRCLIQITQQEIDRVEDLRSNKQQLPAIIEQTNSWIYFEYSHNEVMESEVVLKHLHKYSNSCEKYYPFFIVSVADQKYDICLMVNPNSTEWGKITLLRLVERLKSIYKIIFISEKKLLLKHKPDIDFVSAMQILTDYLTYIGSNSSQNEF